ncbi:AMP-binding protein [Streptomyces sp. CoH27]|uniref:AMP-binding protein n=1 Tax=Streptomyces sp. CoH27 TaxID=2875763 RepID=UPI001CD1EF5F|nr:AMP-binding protein [Streptomyces sp. CoH27]
MQTQDALTRLLDLGRSDRTAVEWCGHALSYDRLGAAVDELTRRLTRAGAARTHVLLHGPATPAYVVGLLAALRSGAVPVPVDAGLTPAQYAWTERITRPSAVLSSDVSPVAQFRGTTGADAGELVLDAATGRVVLGTTGPGRPAGAGQYPDGAAAYLLPTSGSTGDPKAIVGSRTGLHAFLSWFTEEFGLGPDDVCAAVTRVNFDPSLRELLGVLVGGGRLCLPPVDAQLDLAALGAHLAGSRPTLAFLVPSLARRVAEVLPAGAGRPDTLRLAFFAGEVLPARVVRQWTGLAPGAEIVNLYGMTEGTLAQLFRRAVRAEDSAGAWGLPVGRPRPGVTVTLDAADADGRGEVLIASAAPALGILADGPGTAPGTFRVEPLPPVLRTGDVGFRSGDDLVITGRAGNDLKVSGRRVSYHRFVAEVEELPGVAQCVVVDRQGPHALVAVPDPAPGQEAALRERVRAVAARLELPAPAVQVRRELPLLRSGKVDRMALAASVAVQDATPGGARDMPGTPATTAGILLELLDCDSEFTESTAFVEAGIGSLDMITFVARVNRRFGLALTTQDCFGHRDVASLATAVDRAARTPAPTPTAPRAHPDTAPGEPDTLPLSTRQLAYLATCMADGNADWCNLSREVRIERTVTPDEVRAALDTLVARHDVLRLSLTPDWTGQRHTSAAEVRRCPLTVHAAGSRTVQEARFAAVAELIDPATAPAARAALVPGEGTTSVVVVAHHLFLDGLSMDLIARELRTLLLGGTLDGAPPPDAYRAYCTATRRPAGPTPDAAYWRAALKGAAQTELPEATGPGARDGLLLSRPFGVRAVRAAHRLAARTGVSVFAVVLAAFDRAVTRTFGLGPLTLVVPVQAREGVPDTAAGLFMSQLVLRGGPPAPLPDRARDYAGQLAAGTAHSGWEFDQRAADHGLDGADRFPFSTVLFNQHPRPRGLRARDLGSWQPRPLGRSLRFQLQGELQMSAAEMALTYYYRRGITMHDTEVIDRLHAFVVEALCQTGGMSCAD